ncbi:hypothetical protein [Candidatus Mycoplasma mahonii]|uniref:hypothetical protein n=1 Tax=Candidatus Mycoplasma mahonii TaxID=3004105 RepID=UPI0026EE62D8|nr:hypothetical protein [Candidatus Mycoplasma mahonii]WKX02551.1 hypothetical protein O3I44_00515 [Candidatus Mycoplasma mahonii]
MNILLACSAGMSTSLFKKSLNDCMKDQDIEGHTEAHESEVTKGKIKDFDIVFLSHK